MEKREAIAPEELDEVVVAVDGLEEVAGEIEIGPGKEQGVCAGCGHPLGHIPDLGFPGQLSVAPLISMSV